MSGLYWLTDEQMAKLAPFIPKSHGKPRVDDKRVFSRIIFINRNGLRCSSDGAGDRRAVPAHPSPGKFH